MRVHPVALPSTFRALCPASSLLRMTVRQLARSRRSLRSQNSRASSSTKDDAKNNNHVLVIGNRTRLSGGLMLTLLTYWATGRCRT